MQTILTSDIGGTNSRFAAFNLDDSGELTFLKSIWLKTWEAHSFDHLLDNLKTHEFPYTIDNCQVVVAAVPGPVENKCCANLANVPWKVDISHLKRDYGEDRIYLINDFVAQAYACHTRAVADAVMIKPGTPCPGSLTSVIGAGTGLGHCSMAPDGHGGYIPLPSEGGHPAFAFVTPEEQQYGAFVCGKLNVPYVVGDVAVSGKGLSLLYEFHHGEELTPPEVVQRIKPDSVVTHWFARFYARACRHYALNILPLGGLFLTGGVSAKNRFLVDNDIFRNEFVNSIVHSKLLDQIPVELNVNEESGLWGAAFYGKLALH
ncbi:MAG: glucokinase [Kiritimatiellae bacterium]|nr:glucokinase [Kiritimatiellia bacterium]